MWVSSELWKSKVCLLTMMQPSIRMLTCSYSHTWIRERCTEREKDSILTGHLHFYFHEDDKYNNAAGSAVLKMCNKINR